MFVKATNSKSLKVVNTYIRYNVFVIFEPRGCQHGPKMEPRGPPANAASTLHERLLKISDFVRFWVSLGRSVGAPTRTNDLVFSSVSPARGATFAQKSPSIFMIFVRNEGSIGENSKEIEKYFERGPEIQKVIKKHIEYIVFVKVGSKGPRHEWLARSDSRGNQRA